MGFGVGHQGAGTVRVRVRGRAASMGICAEYEYMCLEVVWMLAQTFASLKTQPTLEGGKGRVGVG